jgi:hypothetical protein
MFELRNDKMPGFHMSDRMLYIFFILAFLTYGIGDVLSTYAALNHIYGSSEGLSTTANLISGGFTGYLILLALKTLGLLVFLAMALYGWRLAAAWSLLGFAVYGLYLTASNLTVFLFGFPLLPPGDQQSMLGFIWMMVLPFMVLGIAYETVDSIQIYNGEKQGRGIWGKELTNWAKIKKG